jgi:putative hydrolase of the HAD superfamily
MLSVPVDLYDRAEETLAVLSARYPLMLITKGDTIEQEMKIARTGLAKYFKFIEIVGIKSDTTYEQILQLHYLSPEGFLMVGNSMRSDILPVLRLGGQAVYIPQENTWSHENSDEELPDNGRYFTLEHLWQLPELIHRLETS